MATRQFNLRLEESLIAEIEQAAAELGESKAEFVRKAVEARLIGPEPGSPSPAPKSDSEPKPPKSAPAESEPGLLESIGVPEWNR